MKKLSKMAKLKRRVKVLRKQGRDVDIQGGKIWENTYAGKNFKVKKVKRKKK